MTAATLTQSSAVDECQYATFYVGNLLLGIRIDHVHEINRNVDVTPVPNAPEFVRGVINLRGQVVTVVDLATILGIARTEISRETRNVAIQTQGQLVGLLVDRVADIVAIPAGEIHPPPANVRGVAGKFFKGVHQLESDIVVILEFEQLLEER